MTEKQVMQVIGAVSEISTDQYPLTITKKGKHVRVHARGAEKNIWGSTIMHADRIAEAIRPLKVLWYIDGIDGYPVIIII